MKIHMEIDMLAKLLKDESGATAIEYGLIAALVAIAAMGGMRLLGTSLNSMFSTVGTTLQNAA
jgi:pilus assembly protein Flp/PilA